MKIFPPAKEKEKEKERRWGWRSHYHSDTNCFLGHGSLTKKDQGKTGQTRKVRMGDTQWQSHQPPSSEHQTPNTNRQASLLISRERREKRREERKEKVTLVNDISV